MAEGAKDTYSYSLIDRLSQEAVSPGGRVHSKTAELLREARDVLIEVNQLRSNIIATQNASWSNAVYPLVAILGRAGIVLIGDVSEEQKDLHRRCYGGAGGTPFHPPQASAAAR